MSHDVFISFARGDRELAAYLARNLDERGVSVLSPCSSLRNAIGPTICGGRQRWRIRSASLSFRS
jgi:hypothetical protein